MDHAARGDVRVIYGQHASGLNLQHHRSTALPGHCVSKCLVQVGIAGLSA